MNTTNIKTTWQAWVVCITGSLFFLYEYIQMNMFNAVSPLLMHDFAINATQLGYLSSIYFWSNVLFLFVAGSLLDRFSTRLVMLVSMAICVLGTFGFAFAHSFWPAFLCRFLTGIGSGFCFLSNVRLASRWFPVHRMALITGFIVTMAMIGGFFAQTPLTLLVDAIGWRYALVMDGVLGILVILAIAVIVKDQPGQHIEHAVKEKAQLRELGFWKGWRLAFLRIQNWLGGFYTSFMNLPLILLGGLWGGLYLTQVHHIARLDASKIVSAIWVGTIIGAPLVGWLSDRINRRKLPMIVGTLLSLVTVLIIIYANLNYWQLMALFFMLGFFTSSQVISYPTVAESNTRLLTATSVSVVSITTMSGIAIFEPIYGWLMDMRHGGHVIASTAYEVADFHFAMLIFPVGFIVALIAALLLRETYCKSTHN